MTVQFEPVTGRYLRLELFGRSHRIYVEEAGQGIPLLAFIRRGSDGRQYRALMNDPQIIANHRVHCVRHGLGMESRRRLPVGTTKSIN